MYTATNRLPLDFQWPSFSSTYSIVSPSLCLTRAGGIMLSVLSDHSHDRQRSQQPPTSWTAISGTPWGIIIKFSRNPHFGINRLDFGGQQSLEPLVLWMWYLKNVVRQFHYFWHKYLHTLQDDRIRFWLSNVTVMLCIVKAISQGHLEGVYSNLAQMSTLTQGLMITFWRTKGKVTVMSHLSKFQECIVGFLSNLAQTHT